MFFGKYGTLFMAFWHRAVPTCQKECHYFLSLSLAEVLLYNRVKHENKKEDKI